jgi:formylglycine-generating enzyme required for sulfatase activity
MAGNVREFCLDGYKPYPIVPPENSRRVPLTDPRGGVELRPGHAAKYVVRGGGIFSSMQQSMVFLREAIAADDAAADIGFRVAIECPPIPGSSY